MLHPARHLATPSSTMVVIPACIAALSSDNRVRLHVDEMAHLLRYLEDLEYPDAAAIARAPASLAFARLRNGCRRPSSRLAL